MRTGRVDRRVIRDLPDIKDREEIVTIHARTKPLGEDIHLRTIAERTPGFSGADLYSLMNEGAILAARENRTKVSQYDLIRSIEKVMIGPERRSHLLSEEEKKITAYHEGGHALLASLLPYADPVHKITIISRGHAAGYTLKLPTEERQFHTRKEFLDDITVSLGGYAAEVLMFDDLTTGPSNDLQVATGLAHDMVAKYGMSSGLGPIAFEASGGVLIGRGGFIEKDYSQDVAMRIDNEVEKIMNEGLRRAQELLTKHKQVLDAIAMELIRVEVMERDEYEKILTLHGIKARRKIGEEPYVATAIMGATEPVVTDDAQKETPATETLHHHKPLSEVTHETIVSESGEKTDTARYSRKQKK
jgi:cell division protease FtsH